jgi:5-methylcytosine-specific restriction endonuclease McrA
MKEIRPAGSRVKLDRESYLILHRQILDRDHWRCQSCGSMQNLQVHHLLYRSQTGGDVEENLVTLCAVCHHKQHAAPMQPPMWSDF